MMVHQIVISSLILKRVNRYAVGFWLVAFDVPDNQLRGCFPSGAQTPLGTPPARRHFTVRDKVNRPARRALART